MDDKRRILIVEHHEDWLGILRRAFPEEEFQVEAAHTYHEAVCALETNHFDLTVIDPAAGNSDDESDDYTGQHEGLQTVIEIVHRFPDTRLVFVSGVFDEAILQNTPEIPQDTAVFDKSHWDRTVFRRVVDQVLNGESAAPVEPIITPPPEETIRTGTGLTGPLSTGLHQPLSESQIGKPRVLIIDDRVDWQHILGQLMEHEGYFWRVASNYEIALERLSAETFHIVLLDLLLDDNDIPLRGGKGWHLLDHLVANFPRTKIVVMSGEASGRDIAKLFTDYPIKGFIDKDNFNEAELIGLIRAELTGPLLKIQTLGDFRVWRNGKTITDFGGPDAEILIKLLITRHGESVSVDEISEILFPGQDPKTHYAQINEIIPNARRALEPDLPRPSNSNFILRSGSNYTFNFLANVDIDSEQFRRLVNEGRQHDRHGENEEAMRIFEQAQALYQGDYLPDDRSRQWTLQERSTLQRLYTMTLNRTADLYAEKGMLDKAIETATRSLQVDSYFESTYRRLMRYQYCKGNTKAALTVYKTLVKLFSEFFGDEPELATKRLLEDIEAGRTISCVEVTSVSGEWRITS